METLLPNSEIQAPPEISGAEAAAWAGRQQAFAYLAAHCKAARVECLHQIRETRAYRQFGLTWNEFCPQQAGISRVNADLQISHLKEFGASYFKLAELTRISPATYRQIAGQVHDDVIEINGESIPLTQENGPRIRIALRILHARVRLAEARSDPSTIEISIRVDALLDDMARVTERSLAIDELVSLRAISANAARQWRAFARKLAGKPQ